MKKSRAKRMEVSLSTALPSEDAQIFVRVWRHRGNSVSTWVRTMQDATDFVWSYAKHFNNFEIRYTPEEPMQDA